MGNLEYTVHTEHSVRNEPIGGMDTTIFSLPTRIMSDGDLNIRVLGQFSRALAEKQSKNLGETLHHGEFVITSDPSVVTARAVMHDCENCRTAARTAVRLLKENPTRLLVVGNLYWVVAK